MCARQIILESGNLILAEALKRNIGAYVYVFVCEMAAAATCVFWLGNNPSPWTSRSPTSTGSDGPRDRLRRTWDR